MLDEGCIRRLPESLVNQIAAGEVVSRPSAVAKELIENSLDAQATLIEFGVIDGGKDTLYIRDNGVGMVSGDAERCFSPHTTSKFRTLSDFDHLATMGFRGEALASISAVSKVELKTRHKDSDVGYFVRIEGGEVLEKRPIQVPVGTYIQVKHLFYNTPARRRFLYTDTTEMRHIMDVFYHAALSSKEVGWRFEQYKRNKFHTLYHLKPGSLRRRYIDLFGQGHSKGLLSIQERFSKVGIEGLLGDVSLSRGSRDYQWFFLNGRPIRSPYLSRAVATAYASMLSRDQHPIFALFLDIDPKEVDINVHPSKLEVRFENASTVYGMVLAAVKKALGVGVGGFRFDVEENFLSSVVKAGSGDGVTKGELRDKRWRNLYKDLQREGDSRYDSETLDDEGTSSGLIFPKEEISGKRGIIGYFNRRCAGGDKGYGGERGGEGGDEGGCEGGGRGGEGGAGGFRGIEFGWDRDDMRDWGALFVFSAIGWSCGGA